MGQPTINRLSTACQLHVNRWSTVRRSVQIGSPFIVLARKLPGRLPPICPAALRPDLMCAALPQRTFGCPSSGFDMFHLHWVFTFVFPCRRPEWFYSAPWNRTSKSLALRAPLRPASIPAWPAPPRPARPRHARPPCLAMPCPFRRACEMVEISIRQGPFKMSSAFLWTTASHWELTMNDLSNPKPGYTTGG